MPLIDKTGKSKEFAFIFTPVGTVETEWNRFAWQKNFNKTGDFNQEKESK